jgi:predicted DCC family thiol-disulfide oxidoreductase YuxK
VTTEITVIKHLKEPTRAWALYDGECPICIELARWGRGPLKRRGVEFAHLQTPWVVDRLGISKDDPLRELIVIPNSGAPLGGVDAIVYLIRRIWWAWPLWIAAKLPLINRLLWAGYRWIAARRHCLTGTCSAPRAASADKPHARERALDWLPLFALTGLIIALRPATSPWAFMWALASALFLGFKWLTWIRARREFGDPGPLRSLGYTATNIVFASLPFTYGWAALRGVMP